MSARRYALLAAIALVVAFVSANLIANSWFRSWRIDLTENQLYSLSQGTQRVLNDLTEPVHLTLYYSRDAAAAAPQLQTYAARVREMLQTYAARSGGRVRFTEITVESFSDEEDEARELGLQPVQLFEGSDPVIFGLSGANAIDDRRGIPFLDPRREAFLEYEITRLIWELEHPDRVRVGLITSLPLDPAAAAAPAFGAAPASAFAADMSRLFEVTKLAPDFSEIPDVDVLAIIHPGDLSPAQRYAIDQFILRTGRAFIALDPVSVAAQESGGFNPFNPVAPAPVSSSLDPLLEAWGVSLAPSVVLDLENALRVPAQDERGQPIARGVPQPLVFEVPPEQLNDEDLMTAWLTRGINFALAGGYAWSGREGVEIEPLARTSGRTRRMSAAEAMMATSPLEILRTWPVTGGRVETIALRLDGVLQSAFPEGRPADPPPPPPEGEATQPAAPPAPVESEPHLARSQTPVHLVLVADTDFLDDAYYIDPAQNVSAKDNGAFALNAIDVLGGADALVSLRSRARSERPMELIEAMERDAQRRLQRRQEELEAELSDTEARLQDLLERGGGQGFFGGDLNAVLSPEVRAEVERWRARELELRSQQRSLVRDFRHDIDRLQAVVMFINIWLAPLLIIAAGVFLFWRRQRRGSVRK